MNCRVSVVTIFFNEEEFIREAIASVLGQTLPDWELLLVDDGSADASSQIARRYAEQYPDKVRYLEHENHENRGMSASRNLGIRHARGEYVAFLDADDVWLPHKLARQVELMDSNPEAALLFGHTLHWYSWSGYFKNKKRDFTLRLSVPLGTVVQPPSLLFHFLGNFAEYPCMCSIIIRRAALGGIGLFEESFRGLYEDRVFQAKAFLKAQVLVSGECWDMYRQKPEDSYTDAERKGLYHPTDPHPGELIFWEWFKGYLMAEGVRDARIWGLIESKLWRYRHPLLYFTGEAVKHPVRYTKRLLKQVARWTLPKPFYRWLRARRQGVR